MLIKSKQIIIIFLLLNYSVYSQYDFEFQIDARSNGIKNYRITAIIYPISNNHMHCDTLRQGEINNSYYYQNRNLNSLSFDLEIIYGVHSFETMRTTIEIDSLALKTRVIFRPFIAPNFFECTLEKLNIYYDNNNLEISTLKDFILGDMPVFELKNCNESIIYNYRSENAFNGVLILPTGEQYEGKFYSSDAFHGLELKTEISKAKLDPGQESFSILGEFDPYKFQISGNYRYELYYVFDKLETLKVKKRNELGWIFIKADVFYNYLDFNIAK